MNRNGKPRRLRIAHLTLGLQLGGQEKLLVEFARHADRGRFDLLFVALGGRGPLGVELDRLGWPVTTLDQPAGLRPGLVLGLARLLRHQRVDVLHTHDDRPLLYGAAATRLAPRPRWIHTHHHGRLAQTTPRQSALIALAARLTDRFVCVSHDSGRCLIAGGVPATKVSVLWNGIDLSRFRYSGPAAGGPAVTVARLSPEKDLQTLLRAAALVVRQRPSFRLEIAGDGPCRADLEQTAAALDLGGCVRFLGPVSDVPELLARAGLFVLPSLTEGISLTLLEAMASGLPVLATRVGGNPEIVADSATGLLVPARDPSALAQGIMRLLDRPEEARALGRAGRLRAETNFDVRRMVARYEVQYLDRKEIRPPTLAARTASRPVAKGDEVAECMS